VSKWSAAARGSADSSRRWVLPAVAMPARSSAESVSPFTRRVSLLLHVDSCRHHTRTPGIRAHSRPQLQNGW
jgi:hypothetical protein